MKLREISEILDRKLRADIAESWDNVGLLIGDRDAEIKKILLTLELTGDVMKLALEEKADLVISHHPLIFSGLKKIVSSEGDNLVFELIRNNIAFYAAHTNFDALDGGLNDYVAELIGGKNITMIKSPQEEHAICRIFDIEETSIEDYISHIKSVMNIETLRFTGNTDEKISRAAIVTGSGSEYIDIAVSNGAQFFITGDLKYHYALELKEKGINVLDAGHFDTEKVFPQAMSRFIRRSITELGDIDIIESGADVNPFEYR